MNKKEKMIEWLSEMGRKEWMEILESVSIEQEGRIRRLWDELEKYGEAREVVNEIRRKMKEEL